MKRLFAVNPFAVGRAVLADDDGNVMYFDNKKAAKIERDKLNAEPNSSKEATVTPGPDHHNYKGKRQ